LVTTAAKQLVIDTSSASDFAQAHVSGTINVPASNLVQWAGFFVDYSQPVYLIADEKSLPAHLRSLRSIGIDNVGGYFEATAVKNAGLRTESYRSATPVELRSRIEDGDVALIDVRAATEFEAGHIAGAEHQFLGKLLRNLGSLSNDKPLVTQCLAGGRSAIAASILQRAGFDIVNMQGGYQAWVEAGLPVEHESAAAVA
jgi:hydroxyacylglutathione hydrolase